MKITKIDRDKVYRKFNSKCAYCGNDILIKEMQVDHVIPQSEFEYYLKNKTKIPSFLSHLTETDTHHEDNLFPTCRVCNKWKNNYPLEQFREELSEQVKRLNNYSANFRMAKRFNQLQETPTPITFYFETITPSQK